MTKKKTPPELAKTKKATSKKKVSAKPKSAPSRAESNKKTSAKKTSKPKKTASVKKSSQSKSTETSKPAKKKRVAAKKAAAPAKKAAASKKAVKASPKKAAPSKQSSAGAGKPKARSPKGGDQKKTSEDKQTGSRNVAAKVRPIAFSLDEARRVAQARSKTEKSSPRKQGPGESAPTGKKGAEPQEPKPAARVLGAASLADILGRSPESSPNAIESQKKEIPKKHQRYFEMLQELREHVLSELDLHTKDTLKRSTKEDSGNLSSYGQHMADAGTDSFDRDFALSLVSTEQEALSEIEAALSRIHKGTYGVCEITGKPISKERLLAVPFARFSIEGQVEYEKTQKRPSQRGGAYLDSGGDSGEFLTEDTDE